MLESIGAELKAARESRKITLRQIADETRISLRHLETLERGDLAALPGGIYNRAIIRSYCECLAIDPREYLARYEAALNPPPEKGARAKQRAVLTVSEERRGNPVVLWSFMLLVSVAGLYLSRSWISEVFSPYFARPAIPAPAEVKAPPPPFDVATTTPPAPAPEPIVTSPTPDPPRDESRVKKTSTLRPALRLEFVVLQKCWVSVNSDDNRVQVKLLEPGDTQAFEADERFYVIIGNAGGVQLRLNGKPLRPLGEMGEVVRILITEQNLPDLLEKPDR